MPEPILETVPWGREGKERKLQPADTSADAVWWDS